MGRTIGGGSQRATQGRVKAHGGDGVLGGRPERATVGEATTGKKKMAARRGTPRCGFT
jgi:hypothetical protein